MEICHYSSGLDMAMPQRDHCALGGVKLLYYIEGTNMSLLQDLKFFGYRDLRPIELGGYRSGIARYKKVQSRNIREK